MLFFQTVPDEKSLITRAHLKGWIVDGHSRELKVEMDAFWACRKLHGANRVKLCIHHDASGRTDRVLGKYAKLNQFDASYYNPGLERAVSFMLRFRFQIGGDADQTTRACVVCLGDMGAVDVRPSPEPTEAFTVQVLEKAVVQDLGSDNTGSAINVAGELGKLLGEPVGEWPCPIHINALSLVKTRSKSFLARLAPTQ